MSDSTPCSNCGSLLPGSAAFCTNCGTPVASAPPVPPAAPTYPPSQDPTRVETPGLHDSTQIYSPPPAPAPVAPPPGGAPWQPAPGAAPPPAGAPFAAPPSGPAWQPPPAAPATAPAAWGAAPPTGAPSQPAWTPPGGPAPGAPGAPATKKKGAPINGILAVVGGVLALAGTFTAWVVNSATDAGLSGWDMTSGDKGFRLPSGNLLTFKSSDPYIILALGLAAIVLGIALFAGAAPKPARLAALAVGIVVVVVMVLDWTAITDLVSKNAPSDFEVKTGIGFILATAGGVLIALAGVVPSKKS